MQTEDARDAMRVHHEAAHAVAAAHVGLAIPFDNHFDRITLDDGGSLLRALWRGVERRLDELVNDDMRREAAQLARDVAFVARVGVLARNRLADEPHESGITLADEVIEGAHQALGGWASWPAWAEFSDEIDTRADEFLDDDDVVARIGRLAQAFLEAGELTDHDVAVAV